MCLVGVGLLTLLATGMPAGERDPARDRQTVLVGAPLVGLGGACDGGVVD